MKLSEIFIFYVADDGLRGADETFPILRNIGKRICYLYLPSMKTDTFRPVIIVAILFATSCAGRQFNDIENSRMVKSENNHKYTNDLIHESSPYLLQHAHNPVNWVAWNAVSLQKAKDEDKLILISIGYSACHWCHVMEKESFEDEEVAAFMNEHFVCIKVDREERPDVDQIYMNAVQLISGRGGWPLNCFALPDGRPFFGGTYFPKKNWLYLMQNVVKEYRDNKVKVLEYADELVSGISKSDFIKFNEEDVAYKNIITELVEKWKGLFDRKNGGMNGAPKFPLPNNYEFLLDYAILNQDMEVLNHVELSLDKMAMGGIYDQIGGGFARYSTDEEWKVPHFEKMLYDNAQLISLYSKAYRHFSKSLYLNTIEQSIGFVERELTGEENQFYSALDADSEGEEGKYYTWSQEELNNIAGLNLSFTKKLYSINKDEEWEGKYIMQQKRSDQEIARDLKMSLEDFISLKISTEEILLKEREKRVKPGLDDKSLTSWNGLMISAYCEAYKAVKNEKYLKIAQKTATFLWEKQHTKEGKLLHNYKNKKSTIDGFLEDYALIAKAFVDLYQIDLNPVWLQRSEELTKYTLSHFYDNKSGMFYFTSDEQIDLIARKMEITDNVIPASNSVMAHVLHDLGMLLDKQDMFEKSNQMLKNMAPSMSSYGSAYSNWALLMLKSTHPFYEVAVCGPQYKTKINEMYLGYFPNCLFLGSEKESNLPLLKNKYVNEKTFVYVCVDKTCLLPVESSTEALKQLTFH